MQVDLQSVWLDIQEIKKISPLVHNVTNYVVMEQTANSLLAVGASPVMAHALEEVGDMAAIANSLVLNIGTLSPSWVESMMLALRAANSKAIPTLFDPVGCGATIYRTEVASSILNHGSITAIRGNASEIVALSGKQGLTKGVDSLLKASDYLEHAKILARKNKCTVWMSGETDIITDGERLIFVKNGHPLMGKVTGMGCTATAISGAFLAVNKDPFIGCAHAAVMMGISGEIAALRGEGPGSFKTAFVDTLYNLSLNEIKERICIEAL